MSTRTTLILFLVLVVVAAGVYFIEFRKPAGEASTSSSSAPSSLLNVSLPAISGISVHDVVSNTTVSATRDVSGTWWLAQPANQPADPATMSSVASQVSNIYVQRTLTPTGSLSEYGLVTPTLTVDVKTTSGAMSFSVGDQTPSKGAYYVQKAGDSHVYLVDTGVVQQLQEFADKPPIAQPPTPAARLTVPAPLGPAPGTPAPSPTEVPAVAPTATPS